MKVSAIKTKKVVSGDDLFQLLDQYVESMSELSILAITSKIVAICQDRVADESKKDKLIGKEADLLYPTKLSRYRIYLAIKNGKLVANSGIDQSNVKGQLVLWPTDPVGVANQVRAYLKKRFALERVGVIITDSIVTPLQWGTTGSAIGYSGFKPLKDYIGEKDIFGRELNWTKANVANGLATAAVLLMGEGAEQTPLAVIEEADFVEFIDADPSQQELDSLEIRMEDDLFAPLLTSVEWKKGG